MYICMLYTCLCIYISFCSDLLGLNSNEGRPSDMFSSIDRQINELMRNQDPFADVRPSNAWERL